VLNAARPKSPTIKEMHRIKPVLVKASGHDRPQTRRELSTHSRTSPTTRDGLSKNVAVTSDQR
jgi:hypothetical protein